MKKLIFIFIAITLVSCSNTDLQKSEFLTKVNEIQLKRDKVNQNKFEGDYNYNYSKFQELLTETNSISPINNYPVSDTLLNILKWGLIKDIDVIQSYQKLDKSEPLSLEMYKSFRELEYLENSKKIKSILEIEKSFIINK